VILWHGNFPVDSDTISHVVTKIKSNPNCWDGNLKQYSSYFIWDRPECILNDFYMGISEVVTKDLTLYDRVEYNQSYWTQIYPPNSHGHPKHDHFTGDEVYSWVHFLKPVNKSFHFLVNGEKVYPEQQNPGDYIVFPSWALHAVDDNLSDEERVVIAGNVVLRTISLDYPSGRRKQNICHKINNNIILWEVID
jgi:hypothetical protein